MRFGPKGLLQQDPAASPGIMAPAHCHQSPLLWKSPLQLPRNRRGLCWGRHSEPQRRCNPSSFGCLPQTFRVDESVLGIELWPLFCYHIDRSYVIPRRKFGQPGTRFIFCFHIRAKHVYGGYTGTPVITYYGISNYPFDPTCHGLYFSPFGPLPFDIHRRKPRIFNYHWEFHSRGNEASLYDRSWSQSNDEHRNHFSLRRLQIALLVGMEPSIPPWV